MPSPVPALVSKRRGWPAVPAASGRATGTFVSTAPVLAGKTPRFRARSKAASALPDVGARELAPGPVWSRVSFGLAHGSPVLKEQIENTIQDVKRR
jgi:hypothetical protein